MNGKVRIKDKMRSAYTPDQWMGVQIEVLKGRRLVDPVKLVDWRIKEAVYRGPGDYEWIDRTWRPFKPGDTWGGEDRTAFLKCTVKVPKEYRGECGVLRIVLGGEALLSLNGKPFHGLDEMHDIVFLSDKMKGGEVLNLEIEAYIRQMDDADLYHVFEDAALAVLDREVEETYFDLKCAYEAMESNRAAREARMFLFDQLKRALALIDFETSDRAAFRKSVAAARALIGKKVYESEMYADEGRLNMVGHSHIDLVYLWSYKEFLRKIGRTHSTMLNLMREFPEYLFCQSQMKLYEDLRALYPDIYKEIKALVKKGRWEVIGGMYVEPDCNLTSGESMIRQLLVGRKFMKEEFGVTSSVCWLPDVFGNSWIMPQIMRRCGLKYFITNKLVIWNDTNEFPHNTFWWEGPDGSRLLAHMPCTHFGAEIDADIMLTNWDEYKQKIDCPESIYNYGHGDGRGGPTRDDIMSGRRFRRFPGMPAAEFTSGEQFFERSEAAANDNIPVWKNELYLETHRGTYTTQAILKKFNRKSEILYRNAEIASFFAAGLGMKYPEKTLEEGWKLILKNQFHDILPGSHVTQAREDAKKDYAVVTQLGNAVRNDSLKHIASKINTCGGAPAVAAFNMQSWERGDVFKAEFKTDLKKYKVVDEKGRETVYQEIGRKGGMVTLLIQAGAVPPMGYAVFKLEPGEPEAFGIPFKA
ncbi:MAG TPA: hypothetical protein PLQ76_04495, partial [bacterium]|nr:hypothetical protein [bacterium]